MGSQYEESKTLCDNYDDNSVEPDAFSETILEPDRPKFKFVEGTGNPTTRSHAMKAYWRQKKDERRRQEEVKSYKPALRPLSSSKTRRENDSNFAIQSERTQEPHSDHRDLSTSIQSKQTPGIPDQLFASMSFVLASALGQRPETNSWRLLAHHHRFFYHCEFIYHIFIAP
jgi:hypothetical protein